MAQTSVNFRMDAELKESVEEICRKMGMNLTTAITIFCTKVAQERRIPFEITADPDPFYSESNIRYLEKKMEGASSNYGKLQELIGEKEQKEAKLEERMDRWMYLNELAEKIAAQ